MSMTTENQSPEGEELPPLPDTVYSLFYEDGGDEDHGDEGYQEFLDEPGYTAKEMRDYALAALAAQPADPDGEAFRIAAHLGLTLRFDGGCAQSATPGTPSAYEVVNKRDRAAGMRQAVSQAAAVIAGGGLSHNASMAKLAAQSPAEGDELTPGQLADKCEAWLQSGGASNIVDAYEAGYREAERAGRATHPQPKGIMPGRDWLEGMVDAWRASADESKGFEADAFRTCAADLERALQLNPREALPSPAPAPVLANLTDEQIDEIAKGWVMSLGGDHWYSGERGIKDDSDLLAFARQLIAADRALRAPAPGVVPPRWVSDQVGGEFDDLTAGQGYRKGWNDCRDAMLQAPAVGPWQIDQLRAAMDAAGLPSEWRAPLIGHFCNAINAAASPPPVQKTGGANG